MDPKYRSQNGIYAFSFSGLKTAVLNYVRKNPGTNTADVCASFQKTVVDILVNNTILAAEENHIQEIFIAGGVAANRALREHYQKPGKNTN